MQTKSAAAADETLFFRWRFSQREIVKTPAGTLQKNRAEAVSQSGKQLKQQTV